MAVSKFNPKRLRVNLVDFYRVPKHGVVPDYLTQRYADILQGMQIRGAVELRGDPPITTVAQKTMDDSTAWWLLCAAQQVLHPLDIVTGVDEQGVLRSVLLRIPDLAAYDRLRDQASKPNRGVQEETVEI